MGNTSEERDPKDLAAAAPAGGVPAASPTGWSGFPIAYALRRALRKGYKARDFRADVLAGVVVGIVALPLSMALAIAVGAPPQHGLYTAIFAGFSVSLLGGCKFQVTGPTAAFVVILAPIVTRYGLGGLLTAGLMAGVLLVAMGAFRLGSLIRFIPYPVTTGFTTGIATVIATLQIKDVFGLSVGPMPDHYVEKVAALWQAKGSANLQEVAVAAATLALLLTVPRLTKRVPAPLVAIVLVSFAATVTHRLAPGISVATIGTRFHTTVGGIDVAGIPPVVPMPALPWGESFSFSLVRALFPSAFAIAMLGAIESLLSAVIADGMTGTKHEPNSELVALGIGNIVAPLFGGIAATGALARTATNIRAGARSPIACATHSVVVLLAILVLAPLVAYVPMASLAALLLLVAWNMSEVRHFTGMVRIAPRSDVLVLVTCFLLTVFFDMVVAVSVGFVLAAILFMRRMAAITETKLSLDNTEEHRLIDMPPGVSFYEINGPLFFGAAQNAMEALHASHSDAFHALILHLGKVPIIDATGFAALENAVEGLVKRKKVVIIAGPLPRPRSIFDKTDFERRHVGMIHIAEDLPAALRLARELKAPSSLGTRSTPAPRLASG
ncbi:MAG: C4-dicarboxylic acid transporter DauA [Polyangiaceae bacterium]